MQDKPASIHYICKSVTSLAYLRGMDATDAPLVHFPSFSYSWGWGDLAK